MVLAILGQAIAFTGLILMKLTESYTLLYPTCLLYIISFGVGCGASFPWMPETIPSVGIGMALGVQWFSAGCVGLFVPMMTDGWPGPMGTMTFFCFWCWVGIFALDYVVIETKGKQMDEIGLEYVNFRYRPFRLCPKRVLG
jgi:nitrate/nitrite transporter NarK